MDLLEQLEHLPKILELQRFLVETFSGRIALSDIENMTIHEICSKIDESYQEKCLHLCSVLLRTWNRLADKVKRFEGIRVHAPSTMNDESKDESDESEDVNDEAKDETDEPNDESDESKKINIDSENEIIEPKDETDETKNEDDETKDETDESKDEDVELPDENDKSKEDKVGNDVKSNQNRDTQHVRRSDRKRTQRFEIKPDEIGECDDRNDQDYK